ncbi:MULTISPECIES: phytoene/squalene synthase family protein [Paenibacillus]|uniref:phytoene/squalene synthase family protein n=1 Tax=Paenibacillus TaxID=44249 RepID=UPI0007BEF529|nr:MULTISPECIES: phytoene/squalene synthase family protein [Paenibacillus]MCZ1264158.1 phytoene/squalene synthase family protein [Paenibacillus tundrae]SHN67467.1 phytoene synthase [Paenibacillus sp. ov031]SLK06758.1 phytoene synthase [Paenibacillus sp. RU5A]SOC70636.1 phytoene synthase [Paenibacillus sp. RU26A]SOC72762.1 phytoene synthase [Paenibacillus sp. RU5M]
MNEAILNKCEELMQKGSSSFYQAFRGLPSPRREAVYVIYAFCRMIDDSVDEPEQSPYTIHEIRNLFNQLEEAEGHFIWPALRWLFTSFPHLDKGPFFRQMDGQLTDLKVTHYTTMEELEQYCYLVAGTVGEMLLPVLRDDNGTDVAMNGIALGKGMQIVNIIRDVGEDRARARRYVPLELMEKHGYSEQDWANGVVDERFKAIIHELKAAALGWFRIGMDRLDTYPTESAFAIELAAAFYSTILHAVERNDYDVYTKRAFVSDELKLEMLGAIVKRYPMLAYQASRTAVS